MLHHGLNADCPSVISGLAVRCPGHPLPEPPQEHIRNALAILVGLSERMDHGIYLQLEEDLVAIKSRLWKAVNQLEGK